MRLSLPLRGNGINFPATPQGAIAQLAERLDRTQEVGGSNPPSSTQKFLHLIKFHAARDGP